MLEAGDTIDPGWRSDMALKAGDGVGLGRQGNAVVMEAAGGGRADQIHSGGESARAHHWLGRGSSAVAALSP
ncbi:hypothetical protein E2562_035946 [Oryza meyeriana var. granulata]|uniref:Uncharacterized protein n=1 Tax=Oryza meyeriana var. granulata TaxID=110450 RepID=A0A6G1DSB6_9ORYZ|nr:hypothetical protein E2562_035946 [Oryza meyeriana var. granulata]